MLHLSSFWSLHWGTQMGPMFGLHSDALGPAEGSLDLDGIRLLSSLNLSSSSPSIKSLIFGSASHPSSPVCIPHSQVLASKPQLHVSASNGWNFYHCPSVGFTPRDTGLHSGDQHQMVPFHLLSYPNLGEFWVGTHFLAGMPRKVLHWWFRER